MCAPELKNILVKSGLYFSIFLIWILFNKYSNIKDDIHISDYSDNNKMIIKYNVINEEHIIINISKKFDLIKLDKSNPILIKKINTVTIINMNSSTVSNTDVVYKLF